MTEGRRDPPSAPTAENPLESRAEPEPGAASGQPRSRERSGPLIVERHRKADGRSLILYRDLAEDEPEAAGRG